jgi:hypothetical protein
MAKQDALEMLFSDFMGETVHTAFRKGAPDSDAAHKVWKDIQAMPPNEWLQVCSWMSWALAYSLNDKLEVKKKEG